MSSAARIRAVTVSERRARERAERERLIVRVARELAESEGWDAVTVRRLADRVEYSQPVLYSHFQGKAAIVRAVALDGFTDLARQLHAAWETASSRRALRAVSAAYLRFAAEHPAVYEAMFEMPSDVPFANDDTPEPLRACFAAFTSALPAGTRDIDLAAEVVWSALHGLAALARDGRIPPQHQDARLDLLLSRLAGENQ